mgnify:CR=1 FL=1
MEDVYISGKECVADINGGCIYIRERVCSRNKWRMSIYQGKMCVADINGGCLYIRERVCSRYKWRMSIYQGKSV